MPVLAAFAAAAALSAAAPVAPPADGVFDYQLGGAYAPAAGVAIVDRDRTDPPAPGRYGVCYVNAYQEQPGAHSGMPLLHDAAGRVVIDRDWDEALLDTRSAAKRSWIARIVGGWMKGCAQRGYRAVEPDNLDSWTRSKGLLTRAGNVALARLLTARAHALGLAIAQKNTAELAPQGRAIGFDFAVAEECQVYRECGDYTRTYGREVFEVEYTRTAYAAACKDHGAQISITYRDRDVVPRGRPGYRNESC